MILNHTLLTGDQEQELIIRIHAGDRSAEALLLENNERLIFRIAQPFLRTSAADIEIEDLMQEGRIGLLKAAHKYSFVVAEKRGVKKFSTYASWWIYQYVRRKACRHRSGFSRSVELDDLSYTVHRTQNELLKKLHREPLPREIARASRIPLKKIKLILSVPAIIHLDAQNPHLNNGEVNHESIPDPAIGIPETAETNVLASGYLSSLEDENPRLARVIRMRYGMNTENRTYSLAEIAKAMQITRQRVQQLEQDALEFMRTSQK